MIVFQASTRKKLGKVVNRMTEDPFLREDLMQEAIIHFWKMENQKPGQTLSWYLQSCSFHMRHCLTSGRSVDSRKRRAFRIELPEDEELRDLLLRPMAENPVVAQVAAREIVQLLSRHMSLRERAVLQCLVQGLVGPREIARRLNLSHPTIIKCRRRIAALAIRLGIEPWSAARVRNGSLRGNGSAGSKLIRLRTGPTADHRHNGHAKINGLNGHSNGNGHTNGNGLNGHTNGNELHAHTNRNGLDGLTHGRTTPAGIPSKGAPQARRAGTNGFPRHAESLGAVETSSNGELPRSSIANGKCANGTNHRPIRSP